MATSQKMFNGYLREFREQAGLPLRKVAALLDIDPSTLSKIERGARNANLELVDRFARTFSLDGDQLRKMFLSDRIALDIYKELDAEEILEVAESKIQYIRTIHFRKEKNELNEKKNNE